MAQQTVPYELSQKLEPLCPRDSHSMSYEKTSLQWKEPGTDAIHTLSAYHCGLEGCSVRYSHTDGYFTVVETPDLPYFVEEPGANVLQCPRHGTWLYQAKEESGEPTWRCGVQDCDYWTRH
jgi:hypothetical protein